MSSPLDPNQLRNTDAICQLKSYSDIIFSKGSNACDSDYSCLTIERALREIRTESQFVCIRSQVNKIRYPEYFYIPFQALDRFFSLKPDELCNDLNTIICPMLGTKSL